MVTETAEKKSVYSSMLEWQYFTLLGELQQLQLHAADSSCPCWLKDLGEYCYPKHAMNVYSLAAETMAMDKANEELLAELAEDAKELHLKLKAHVCSEGESMDVVEWSRSWRKKLEPIYYACSVKPRTSVQTGLPGMGKEEAQSKMRIADMADVFTVKMKVFSPDNKRNKIYDATVDTGADWASIPRKDAEELGLAHYSTDKTQTPIGIFPVDYYLGQVEVEGIMAGGLFAASDYPTIGSKFFQFGGFKVNPMEHKLEKIPFKAMGFNGGAEMHSHKSTKPICTGEQRERRESCILDLKAHNRESGCKAEGTGSKKCPGVFAVCTKSIGCRLGRGKN